MKAVVFHAIGDIRLEDVPEPKLEQPTDAIIRLTASAICGTDLHFVRGTFSGMKPGTVLGHEGVGVVEQLGPMVRNFEVGDRVIIPSTIGCGFCSYCRAGYFAQCATPPIRAASGRARTKPPRSPAVPRARSRAVQSRWPRFRAAPGRDSCFGFRQADR